MISVLVVVPLAQASDPSTFELIQKIQTLQKRLISKTEEVVEKELLLQVWFSLSIRHEQVYFLSRIMFLELVIGQQCMSHI
jgi:hypothetical protein